MSIQSDSSATADAKVELPGLPSATSSAKAQARDFIKQATIFVLIGFLIYVGVYAVAEQLVNQTTVRNRFFTIKNAPYAQYDYVILGASHAAAFDYEDTNAQLQQMTGAKIINLSTVGGGITVNRLFLEYFLAGHQTKSVMYVLDSFAFYSRQWNEDRFNDTRLYDRAPFDPTLAGLLVQNPTMRSIAPDYILGFSKINNADRFKSDISDDEATKFTKTYRPVKQIDVQRMEYLYPKKIDPETFRHYLAEFEDLVRYLKQRNIRLIVVKPPIPTRVYNMLPDEAQFDEMLKPVLAQSGIEFHDFSLVGNDEKFFFNTDHLNKTGVLDFFENDLKQVLAR